MISIARASLAERGCIANGILKKGALHIKLSAQDHENNRCKSRVRTNIERIFGHLKQWQNYRRVRYLGLVKNQLELTLKAVAYNLKRLAKILSNKPPDRGTGARRPLRPGRQKQPAGTLN